MKSLLASLLIACVASASVAQNTYPTKPVTAIVGYPPGGAADIVTRQLAVLMGSKFPSGLVVENKPGAGGSTAVASLSQAKADGYQFASVPNSNLALSPQVNQLSYKTPDDIEPIINIVSFSPIVVVPNSSPLKSIKDLIQAAKANPGTVSVGYPGDTTLSHLNLLELERVAGVDVLKVPFKGWGQGGPQLLGGHITASIAQPVEATSFLKAGTMRAIGSFSEIRQPGLPNVPTVKEQGFPVAMGVRYLLITTKGTPPHVVKYIHDAAKVAMETPHFKEFAAANALEIAYQDGATAREAAWSDYRKYTSVLKQSGLVK